MTQHFVGGNRIGRRHDRTECNRGGDRQTGKAPSQERDRRRRQHDRNHGQRSNRNGVAAQIARRGVKGGVEQRRRHEQRQCELRLDSDLRSEWQESEARTRDREPGS